jgi:hypothetical protein
MHGGGAAQTWANEGPRPPARPRSRTASSHLRPVGTHTAGIGAAPRTRARFARSKGIRPGASERIRQCPSAVSAARGERFPLASGGRRPTLNQGCATIAQAESFVASEGVRLPACGSCACPAARRHGRARVASRSSTCCTGRASSRIRAARRPDLKRTDGSAAGVSGPPSRGTAPLPCCSLLHDEPIRAWGGSSHLIRTRSGRGSFHLLAAFGRVWGRFVTAS